MKNLNLVCMLAISAMTATVAQATPLFDNYNYDTASAAHAKAPALNQARSAEAIGNYRMIATASRSFRGDFAKKEITGIANADLSVLNLLVEPTADATSVEVTQVNLIKAGQNQGPATVVYKDGATLAFAQFSYKNGGAINDAVFFFSECKLTAERELLCAKRFMAQDPGQLNPQQRALHNTIVGYDLYVR